MKNNHRIFIELYKEALANASNLHDEASILLNSEKFPRAYFLAITGLEELSKALLAADVSTGLITEREFSSYYKKHDEKIPRVEWASREAFPTLFKGKRRTIKDPRPTIEKREDSLYVRRIETGLSTPVKSISEEDARMLCRTLGTAIRRIELASEHYGEYIGTKGLILLRKKLRGIDPDL